MINYDRKYSREELWNIDPVSVYKIVLHGKYNKKFPDNYWDRPDCLDLCKQIVIFLIEEQFKWSEEDIKKKLSRKIFIDYGLTGMLNIVFAGSPYAAIDNAYPGKFHSWEFSRCAKSYWNYETAKEAVKWLIEDKLQWSEDEIKDNLSTNTFKRNNLAGMLTIVFKNSPYKAIESVYKGKFKPWEFSCCGRSYWNKNTAKDATIWMIEDKLKWSDEDIKNYLSQKVFYDNGLGGMLTLIFNGSPYAAIDTVYPGKFHPWELSNCPSGFWNKDTAKEATIWLLEKKLKWSDKDIEENLSRKTFEDNGLGGMLSLVFNNSPYAAIENAYPEKFQRIDLKRCK